MRNLLYSCVLIAALMVPLTLQAADRSKPAGPHPAGGKVKMEFVNTKLVHVLEWFSQKARMNFILPHSYSKERITIISAEPVPLEEAYQALQAALDVERLRIKPVGRFALITRKPRKEKGVPGSGNTKKPVN